ncbi:VWA domain-containing protein [Streptomyces sp. NPDC048751]|uniref:phosphorylase family protein n=1 Tax=Streptomyces sp. NPDC048751 TaxID=3365591 RepID=UPI00371FAD4D
MTDFPPTVVILTALPVEYAAVRAHLTDVVRREDDYGTVFDCGRLADTGLVAAVALIGEGNENAALITGQAYNLFGPRALLFVGVAGALSEDLEIGDVVVATRIYAYHGAKMNPGASLARPRAWDASWRLLQAAYRATHEPDVTVHYKPIAAGEVVLNDRASNLSEHLEKNYNDAVAIEMESAGVARAAHVSGRLDTLTIRCISDKADGRKREADARGTQRLAASRAATIAVAVLREFAKSVVTRQHTGHDYDRATSAQPRATEGPWATAAPVSRATQDPGARDPGTADLGAAAGLGAQDLGALGPGATERTGPAAGHPTVEMHGTGEGRWAPGTPGTTGVDGVPGMPGTPGHHGPLVTPGAARDHGAQEVSEATRERGAPETPDAVRGQGTVGTPDAVIGQGTVGTPEATRTDGALEAPDATRADGAPDATRANGALEAPRAAEGPRPTGASAPVTHPPTPVTARARRSGPVPPVPAAFSDGPATAPSTPAGASSPTTATSAPGDASSSPTPATRPNPPSPGGTASGTGRAPVDGRAPLSRGLRAARRHLTPLRAAGLACVLILGALVPVVFSGDDGSSSDPGAGSSLPTCPVAKADTTLRISASIDLSKSLRNAADAYGARRAHGRCVKITVSGVNSGTGMRALAKGWTEADGPEPPDVWSPAGSEWLELARSKASPRALKLLPETAEPIVTSPLTIAMPKTMATALGWPEQRIGWKELAKWAKDPADFWADRGEKQWGALKLGKTNPHYSTSGLNATIGAFYANTGTSAELSEKDIDSPANQALVKTIEKSVVHYGDTTLTFLSNLRAADDSGGEDEVARYISAVTVEENAVVTYNQGYPCGAYSDEPECAKTHKPRTPLVSLYPKDSNPVSDHPYVTLNRLSPAKKTVSADFLRHLHDRDVYEKYFAPYGYRTHDLKPGASITEENGALPGTRLSAYNPPKGKVLDRIQQTWSRLRRPANVLVVIDTSLSMEDKVPGTGRTKMQLLKDAEPALFGEFGPADRVGLWKFSNAANLDGKHHYQELVPVGPMNDPAPGANGVPRREQLTKEVRALVPNGATGLYGTVDAAAKALRQGFDPDAINAIVLLTDGRNEGVPATPTLEEVLSRIGGSDDRVRIFTIAYGSDADEQDAGGRTVLEKIAAATGARAYDAKNPKVIGQVLTSVISNF